MSVKCPLAVRVATTEPTTLAPTLRMAVSPNRMSGPVGVKLASDSLTHGGSTRMPIRRHSAR